MDGSAEMSFVNRYVLKSRRKRLLYELSTPSKRRDALSRFCHQAPQLLDSARIRMQGEDLDRSAPFLSFVRDHDGLCLVLSPDCYPDGEQMMLHDALSWAVSWPDAVLILGNGFAVVFGEVVKGGRGKYLLV